LILTEAQRRTFDAAGSALGLAARPALAVLFFFSSLLNCMNQNPAYLHGDVTSAINACAIAVHKELGPGFLEHIYEEALCVEFDRRRIAYQRQLPVRISYRGMPVGLYKLDLVIDRKVVVEIKAVEAIHEAHLAAALAYLKATGLAVGLIVNFADSVMRSRRVFRPAHWGDKEEEKKRTASGAASPPLTGDGVFSKSNIGDKDVSNDNERTLQDSELVRLQPEFDQPRQPDDLV
jgi:GxxExxY protein